MNASDETIWSEHRERLMRFVLSRGVEHHDAEDIVHEVLAKALLPGGGPTTPGRLQQWLYQVLRNAIADHWRRKRPSEQVPEDFAAESVTDHGQHPDDLLACIQPFLANLSEEDSKLLKLADEEQLTQKEIAGRLGLSLSGAKSRIQRARARVLGMYRACCSVELDRKGRLVDYDSKGCDTACPTGKDTSCSPTTGVDRPANQPRRTP